MMIRTIQKIDKIYRDGSLIGEMRVFELWLFGVLRIYAHVHYAQAKAG